jgi:penicillin-binding protein 1A
MKNQGIRQGPGHFFYQLIVRLFAPGRRRWLKYLVTAIVIVTGFFVGLFLATWIGVFGKLPNKDELAKVENPLASEVYSADSILLGRYFLQERSNIEFESLPRHAIDAVLATEDVRFYEHHGVDFRSLGRVFVKTLLFQNESSGGGSTITQQLAKNMYHRRRYAMFSTLINKFKEIITATRLENVYDKNALLALYLNTVPFGENTYGLDAAAQRFFSVHARDLTVPQSAVLIGMLKATRSYNPRLFPERSQHRRNVVLSQMHKYGMLDRPAFDSLSNQELNLKYNRITHHTGPAPYFREYLRTELLKWCNDYENKTGLAINLYTSGLKIYTTIDSRMQAHAEEAMAKQMAVIQKKFLQHWGKTDPWAANPEVLQNAIKQSPLYRTLLDSGKSHDDIMKEMSRPLPMSVFTWEGDKEATMSAVDSIKHYLRFLNAGMLGIDPLNGGVKVWVGGINHLYFQYDHVKPTTKRQVGSTFKPIVYAAAIERGARPCSYITAEKTVYNNMEEWAPQNTEDNYGLKYSMPGALAFSVNTVSVKVLEKAGLHETALLAKRMGIESPLPEVPSMALGTPDISMTEMVAAYATFANGGKAVKPFYITAITNPNGQVLEQFEPEASVQAVSQETSLLVLHMLRRAVNEGTSAALRSQFGLTNDIAGKTGTTQSNTDGWFIAITPRLIIGSWVGADNPAIHFRSTALGQGSRTALPLVGEFFRMSSNDASLDSIMKVSFQPLSADLHSRISCDMYKVDRNIFRKLTGRKEKKRDFNDKSKPRKGLKGLFKKKEKD